MKKKRTHRLLLTLSVAGCVLGIIISGIYFYNLPLRQRKTYTITLTKDSFSPSKLAIYEGDTVVFKTTGNESFWPASDFHPTHSLYPQFDPKRALSPKDSWAFTFDKVGVWNFHDHLSSSKKGVITVNPRTVTFGIGSTTCPLEDVICWKRLVEKRVQAQGLSKAFDLIDELPPETASVRCHDIAHFLGEAAFKLYQKKIPIQIGAQKLSQCGFGFYHGFLTVLYANTHDLKTARGFCETVKKNDEFTHSGVESACYHGLGHGLMEETPNKSSWGDPFKIVEAPLKKCMIVTDNPEMQGYCTSGVFNSLAVLMTSGQYGLSYSKTNPYEICDDGRYTGLVKDGCYSQMNTVAYFASGGDIAKGVRFAESIHDQSYIPTAMSLYSAYYAKNNQNLTLFTKVIASCRTAVNKQTRDACITGYASGLIEFGAPPKEYEKSTRFCNNGSLSGDEKALCATKIGWFFKSIYKIDKVKQACKLVDETYRDYCLNK